MLDGGVMRIEKDFARREPIEEVEFCGRSSPKHGLKGREASCSAPESVMHI